jgi:hypothetical protein
MTTDLYDIDTVTAKELLRAEIRARGFAPMTDAALADACDRFRIARHNNVIEGIVPHPTTAALMEVLFEERVWASDWDDMLTDFMLRHMVPANAHSASVA